MEIISCFAWDFSSLEPLYERELQTEENEILLDHGMTGHWSFLRFSVLSILLKILSYITPILALVLGCDIFSGFFFFLYESV
jgi:hypothetical protein